MNTIQLRAGQTSQAFPLGIGSVASLSTNNVGTWSAYIEYSFDTQEKINSNTATWTTWPRGTVTAPTQGAALFPMFARATCLTGNIQAFFGDPTGLTAIQAIPWDTSLSLITPSGVLAGAVVPTTTWANRPLPVTSYPNATIRITDVGGNTGTGGGSFFYTNGTRWKPQSAVLLDSVDTPNSAPANTSENQLNPNHIIVPPGVLGVNGDRLRIRMTLSKNAGAENATINLRFGPLGTTADPIIATVTTLAGANQTLGDVLDFKRTSATTLQKQGNASTDNSYGGANSGAFPAAVTISNLDGNGMYLSITSQVNVGAEIVTLQDYTLEFWPTDSA